MYRRPFGPFVATGLLAALLVAAWAYSPDRPLTTTHAAHPSQCEVRFQPTTVDAGEVLPEARVTLSESIGEIYEVETPEDSGLTVLWIHNGGDSDPPRVRVSALGAEPGRWEVTLRGEFGDCSGSFTVE